MSIKLYITAIESKENGSAVTLFEDYQLAYQDKNRLLNSVNNINEAIFNKIEEVELSNDQATTPF